MSTKRDRYTFENNVSIPPAIAKVVADLLRQWDNCHDTDHNYLKCFAEDATLNLAPNSATGHHAIRDMRNYAIHPERGLITACQHTLHRLYILAGDQPGQGVNVAFTSRVEYTIGGKPYPEEFSTTFDLVGNEKKGYVVKYARIYLDNVNIGKAMSELVPNATA